MLRWMLMGGLTLLTAGCVQPGGPAWMKGNPSVVYVVVKTAPSGATVQFPDGTSCETPCRIGVTTPLQMTVGRTGYTAVSRTITRSTPSPLTMTLEPVRDVGTIEEIDVPDL